MLSAYKERCSLYGFIDLTEKNIEHTLSSFRLMHQDIIKPFSHLWYTESHLEEQSIIILIWILKKPSGRGWAEVKRKVLQISHHGAQNEENKHVQPKVSAQARGFCLMRGETGKEKVREGDWMINMHYITHFRDNQELWWEHLCLLVIKA